MRLDSGWPASGGIGVSGHVARHTLGAAGVTIKGADGIDEQPASARLDRTATARNALDFTSHDLDTSLNDAPLLVPLLRILGLKSGMPGSE